MFRSNNSISGMTLAEVLVAAGFTGLVAIGVMHLVSNYREQAWGQESVADAMKSKDVVSELIRAKVPGSIAANSVTDPTANSAIWDCPAGGPCKFLSSAIDGVELTVTCESTSGMPFIKDAPFASVANLGANCSSCADGTRPVMTVKHYVNGSLKRSLKFPDPNKKPKFKGDLGMALCFSAPSYVDEDGVTKWDMWKVTIAPVYFVAPPKTSDRALRLAGIFKAHPEELMLSGMSQLGSSISVLPGGGTSGTTGSTGSTGTSGTSGP